MRTIQGERIDVLYPDSIGAPIMWRPARIVGARWRETTLTRGATSRSDVEVISDVEAVFNDMGSVVPGPGFGG